MQTKQELSLPFTHSISCTTTRLHHTPAFASSIASKYCSCLPCSKLKPGRGHCRDPSFKSCNHFQSICSSFTPLPHHREAFTPFVRPSIWVPAWRNTHRKQSMAGRSPAAHGDRVGNATLNLLFMTVTAPTPVPSHSRTFTTRALFLKHGALKSKRMSAWFIRPPCRHFDTLNYADAELFVTRCLGTLDASCIAILCSHCIPYLSHAAIIY